MMAFLAKQQSVIINKDVISLSGETGRDGICFDATDLLKITNKYETDQPKNFPVRFLLNFILTFYDFSLSFLIFKEIPYFYQAVFVPSQDFLPNMIQSRT